MKNKSLVSLDIKSFQTNIPESKCIKHLENLLKKTNISLLLPFKIIIKVCSLYAKYFFFQNYDSFFKQNFNLLMASRLHGGLVIFLFS